MLHEFIQLFKKAHDENERKKAKAEQLQKQQEAEARKKHALEKARMLAAQEEMERVKQKAEDAEIEARGGAILPYSQEDDEDPGGISPPNESPRAGVVGQGGLGAPNAAELLRQKFMRVTSKSEDSDMGSDFSDDDDSTVSARAPPPFGADVIPNVGVYAMSPARLGNDMSSLRRTASVDLLTSFLPPPPPPQKRNPYAPEKGVDDLALRYTRMTDIETK